MRTEFSRDKIVALCKNRGYIFSGSEIYGGLANCWDYGPLGVLFLNNIKGAWWRKFVQESPYNVGVDCAILMNPEVWVASGHVVNFNDPLMDCRACKARFRADKLIEDYAEANGLADVHPDGWTLLAVSPCSLSLLPDKDFTVRSTTCRPDTAPLGIDCGRHPSFVD